ncbi:hypothetical protein BC941DRAFT_423497 [Chlamydoabsidia padenii]|nr:hypothetical protein BC941DRAFT_423497 [Chlamydoabsidia padenii]
MSTKVIPAVNNDLVGDGSVLENNQLWSIIAKQRMTIKQLETALVNMTKDRDLLLLVVNRQPSPPTPTPTCSLSPSHEPVLPPRSPFRQHYRAQEESTTTICTAKGTTTRLLPTAVEPSAIKCTQTLSASSSSPSTTPLISPSRLPLPSQSTCVLAKDTQHNEQPLSRVLSQPNLIATATQAPRIFFTNMNMITVKVVDISLQQSTKNKSVVVFIISVYNKSLALTTNKDTNRDGLLWRIKKVYSDFKALDTLLHSHIRPAANNKSTTMMKLEKLPEKSLFATRTSSRTKLDQKKKLIEKYLTRAIRCPLPETTGLIEFLSSDICEQDQKSGPLSLKAPCQKEGYLSLKIDQSNEWHPYYFMLHGSTLDYYNSKGGPFVGSITLTDGHMTVQRPPSSGTGLLHASNRSTFTLTKQNRSTILGVESETELNEWVQALSTLAQPTKIPKVSLSTTHRTSICRFVNNNKSCTPTLQQQRLDNQPANRHPQRSNSDTSIYPDEHRTLLMAYKSDIIPTATTTLGLLPARRTSLDDILPHVTTSTLYQGKKDDLAKKAKSKLNRRTFWPKNIFSHHDNNSGVLRGFLLSRHSSEDTLSASVSSSFRLTRHQQRPTSQYVDSSMAIKMNLFSVPLDKTRLISDIPVVVYRCIDFLEKRQAVYEEGIYRLSGSTVKIKALRREFEEKGDFDLLASEEHQHCDVHAVSGLLKLWLRELPSNILTENVLKKVTLIKDQDDCLSELVRLVTTLPLVNYNLLRALSAHLLNVVRHSGINKMTLRNMGIVFSPTLGIPISIFNMFLCKFDRLFGKHPPLDPMEDGMATGANRSSSMYSRASEYQEGVLDESDLNEPSSIDNSDVSNGDPIAAQHVK